MDLEVRAEADHTDASQDAHTSVGAGDDPETGTYRDLGGCMANRAVGRWGWMPLSRDL